MKPNEYYERFVQYEWNHISDPLKESILKAISVAYSDGHKIGLSTNKDEFDGDRITIDKSELIRRIDIIVSEPNGIVRDTMINNLLI